MVQSARHDTPPEDISHYTTLQGLQGIIQSGCLWASNASFLNDKAELQHALGVSKQVIEKLSSVKAFKQWKATLKRVFDELEYEGIPDTYVACFCKDSDNLSQWRGYGGAVQGISVTFDRVKLASRLKSERAVFFKVQYSRKTTVTKLMSALTTELRRIAELDELTGGSTPEEQHRKVHKRVSALLPRFKHLGFRDEKEWRFAIQKEISPKERRFRVSNNKLVPYIEIGRGQGLLPIKSVRIGPGPDPELAKQSVRVFMTANGYEVPIRMSNVPFRA